MALRILDVFNLQLGNNVRGRPRTKPNSMNHGIYQHDIGISDSNDSSLDTIFNHRTYDSQVPDVAGEEVIDDSNDDDDRGTTLSTNRFYGRNGNNGNNVRLKSQAESTYMMEKTFKQKKIAGQGLHIAVGVAGKKKATRKDKGSPRVTAYMLWAKDQRANFIKKFPHMDFSSISKKLSDLWATVPQNQKRMWKTKAAKIMRKRANGAGAENIKNSARPLLTKSLPTSFPQRKGMKNTTPQEVYLPRRPPGRPPKNPLAPPTSSTTSSLVHVGAPRSLLPATKPNFSKGSSQFHKKSKTQTAFAPNTASPKLTVEIPTSSSFK